jgi:hypothetical protein
MATMKTPKIQGDYGRHQRGSNDQGPPQGAYEPRVIARGGQSPLGNALARNVNGGGPGTGRDVYRSGAQMSHGSANPGQPPMRPRSDDVMDP